MKKLDKMGRFYNRIVLLSFITAFSLSSNAFAQEGSALLSGIEINPSDNNSYQIVLRSDKKVPFKKFVTADDKIVLELNGIKTEGSVETNYNNAANIDHVIVHPTGNGNLRVFIQGDNISAGKILFENQPGSLSFLNEPAASIQGQTPEQETPAVNPSESLNSLQTQTQAQVLNENDSLQSNQDEETIVLDKPVNSYTQNRIQSNVLEEETDTSPNETNSILASFKNVFGKTSIDWLLKLGIIVLLIIAGVKLLNPKRDIRIDLSAETKNRDINLLNSLNRDILSRNTGNMPSLKVGSTMKTPWKTLSSYGLREYQNSQVSPFKNTSGLQNKKEIYTTSGLSKPKPFAKVPSNPVLPKPSNTRTAVLQKPAVSSSEMHKAKSNIDSLKFLETMAKIYERNGRADLAQNINLSIAQGKQNIRENSFIK